LYITEEEGNRWAINDRKAEPATIVVHLCHP
jgi:hypothetical protein